MSEVTNVNVTPYTTPVYEYWSTGTGNTFSYGWSNTIYMYQITCPKRSCKKMNWMELNKITPCTKCGAKLKAVEEQADYEIAVGA